MRRGSTATGARSGGKSTSSVCLFASAWGNMLSIAGLINRGGNEKFAQRSGPASNERCARKDDRENDEREADLFRAALHAQLPGWTRAVRGPSRSPAVTIHRTR